MSVTYNVHFEEFPTIQSLVNANNTRKLNKAFAKEPEDWLGSKRIESPGGRKKKYYDSENYEEAENLLVNGWDKHVNELMKGGERLSVKTNTMSERRKPGAGVVGYAPIVPNAIRGLPNSMITTETIKQKAKAVTIIYSPSVNASWRIEPIINSGIAVMKIVRMLELQGIRVKISIEAISTTAAKQLAVLRVDVKDWREGLDIKKLAFPLIHPSMQRRMGLRWIETCPQIKHAGFINGYGKPINNKTYEQAVDILKHNGLLKNNEYYINAQLCVDKSFNEIEIMKAAGMVGLLKNKRSA